MGNIFKIYKKDSLMFATHSSLTLEKIKKIPPQLFLFFPKHTKKGNFLQIVILVLDNFLFSKKMKDCENKKKNGKK